MVGRSCLVFSLLATLPLSGCLGDGASGDAETEGLDASGDGAGADGAAPDRKAAVEAGALTPVPTPFSWNGTVGHQAGACAAGGCVIASLLPQWDNTRKATGLVGGDLTMTWDVPYDLGFGLATNCGEAFRAFYCRFVASTEGTPPLTLDLDGLDPDRRYNLVAWHPYRGTEVAGVQSGVETAFHVEGTLLVV